MSNEEQMLVYAKMHEEWSNNLMTKIVLNALKAHGEKHITMLNRDALNTSVDNNTIRNIVVSFQNTNAIISLLSDFKQLEKYLTKEK